MPVDHETHRRGNVRGQAGRNSQARDLQQSAQASADPGPGQRQRHSLRSRVLSPLQRLTIPFFFNFEIF